MKTVSQKILVTGVAGFLGSHLSEKLSLMGHNVIGVDNMSGGYKDNIPANIKFFNVFIKFPSYCFKVKFLKKNFNQNIINL